MRLFLIVILTLCGNELLTVNGVQKIPSDSNSCPVISPDDFDFSSITFEYYRRERRENNAVVWCGSSNETAGHFVQFSFRKLTYVCSINTEAAAENRLVRSYNLTRSSDGVLWHDYPYTIEVDGANSGKNVVPILAARYLRIYPVTWTKWPCMKVSFTAMQLDDVRLEVLSEGWSDLVLSKRKPNCSIKVNSEEKCPGKIGHNVIVLDPSTGDVVNATYFNTSSDDTAANELANFIETQENQSIIIVAVLGAGHRLHGEENVSSLYDIGAVSPLVPCENCSWITVGKKGSRKPWTTQISRLYSKGPAKLDLYIPLEENNDPQFFWRLDKKVSNLYLIEEKNNLKTWIEGRGIVDWHCFETRSNSRAKTTTISESTCMVNPDKCPGGLTVSFWNHRQQQYLPIRMTYYPRFKAYDKETLCPHSWLTTSNKCCIFPFTYKGVTYNTCTSVDSDRLWCAVSPLFDQDNERGNCAGCNHPLIVTNEMFSGSSSFRSSETKAVHAHFTSASCWSPSGKDATPFLTVFTKTIFLITAIGTKGGVIGNENHWVKSYYIRYSFIGQHWQLYFEDFLEKVFKGNIDVATEVRNELKHTIKVRYVRFYPQAHTNKIALKLQLYGCDEDEYPMVQRDPPALPVKVSECEHPLGLQEDKVAFWLASSIGDNRKASHARLNGQSFWKAAGSDASPYLMVTIMDKVFVTAVATQGATGTDNVARYVTSYYLTFSTNRVDWNEYLEDDKLKIFKGNQDAATVVKNRLKHHIELLHVKIHPKTWENNIAMRAEFYGCLRDNPKFSIIGPVYKIYQGGEFPTQRNQYVSVAVRICPTNLPCPNCKRKVYVQIEDKRLCMEELNANLQADCKFREVNVTLNPVRKGFQYYYQVSSVNVFDSIGQTCLPSPVPSSFAVVGHMNTFQDTVGSCLQRLYNGDITNGVYTLRTKHGRARVYCDQTTMGGGWMVIQRRFDGTVDFNRTWDSYYHGFGSLDGEFWLGLQTINTFRIYGSSYDLSMRVDLENFNDEVGYAYYALTKMKHNYELEVSKYSGTIGDALNSIHNLTTFTTNDRDTPNRCSNKYNNGWWTNNTHSNCGTANLNGPYNKMTWNTWNGNQPVKTSEIKIRPAKQVSCSEWACYFYRRAIRLDYGSNHCITMGGFMTSITSANEMNFLIQFLNSQAPIPEKVGIGLRVNKDGNLIWLDSSLVTFRPSHSLNKSADCFYLARIGDTFDSYRWDPAKCSDKSSHMPYVCKKGITCHQMDCFYNFQHKNIKCATTKEVCKNKGSQLTQIYNKKKDKFITKYIKDGVRTDQPDSRYNYTNWESGEIPNPSKCVVQYKTGWKLDNLDVKRPSLCEKSIGGYAKTCEDTAKFGVEESSYYNIMNRLLFCDMENDGGGWTVIMRRTDDSSSFENRTWTEYQNGFYNQLSSYWAGNNKIRSLTEKNHHTLLINFVLTNGSKYYALYDKFSLGPHNHQFSLFVTGYSGNAGDSLSAHHGAKFSAFDRDYDQNNSINCAQTFGGGWWFKRDCHESNLNGKYNITAGNRHHIYWRTLNAPIKYVEMKIKLITKTAFNARYLRTMDTFNHRGFTFRHDGLQTEITVRTSQKRWQLFFKPPLYDWYHVCVTWSEASGLRYYENGVLMSYTVKYTRVSDTPPGTRLMIGDQYGHGYLYGFVTRLGIWGRQLEQYAINDIYNFDNFTFDTDRQVWKKGPIRNHKNRPFDWTRTSGCTPSEGTGPCADYTWGNKRGSYLFAEASSPRVKNNFSSLAYPAFSNTIYRCLRFRYHMRGSGEGFLGVNRGNRRIWQAKQNNRNDWQHTQVIDYNMLFYSGEMEIVAYVNENFESDIAIDDVSLDVRPCVSMSFDDVPNYESLGCFKDNGGLGSLESSIFLINDIPFDQRTDSIRKCAHAAWTRSVTVFALRNGLCRGHPTSHLTYSASLPATNCPANGKGDNDNMHVYAFRDCDPKCAKGIQCDLQTRSCSCSQMKHVDHSCRSILPKTVYVDASHYWPFDNSEEIVDLIGNKPVIVKGKVSTATKAPLNNGVQLDGLSSIIGLGDFLNECTGDFDLCQDGFTISVWLKHFLTLAKVSKHIFISMGSSTATEKGFKLVYDPAVQVQGAIPSVSLIVTFKDRTCVFKVPFHQGIWSQFGFAFKDSTMLNVYHNGQRVAASMSEACQAVSATQSTNHTLLVGMAMQNSAFQIDDLVIWNKWLNETDYKNRFRFTSVGDKQEINLLLKLTNEVWHDSLHDLESLKATTLMQTIAENFKLMFSDYNGNRPVTISINGFSKGSVNVNVTLLFNSLSYNDSLLLEKWLYEKQLLNNMQVNVLDISSSTVPETFPKVITTPLTLTSIHLQWNVENFGSFYQLFQGYRVLYKQVDRPADNYSVFTIWGATNNTIVTNLEPGTNYTMRMLVIALSGDGLISPIFYAETKTNVPNGIPSNLTAVNTSSTSLLLNWTHIETLKWRGVPLGYRIVYWPPDVPGDPVLNLTTLPQFDYFELKQLRKFVTYCVKVAAFNRGGDGNFSKPVCAKTDEDVPDVPPPNIKIQNITSTIVLMSSTGIPMLNRNGIIVNYTAHWREYNGTKTGIVLCINGTIVSCTITGLSHYSRYNISMVAYTRKGPSPFVWYTVLTAESVPSVPPPNVLGYNLSSTSINLTWASIPSEYHHGVFKGYFIKYAIKNTNNWQIIYVCKTSTTLTFTQLKPYREYNVSIAGFTGGGIGNFTTVFVWTDEDIPFSPPIGFNGTNTSSTSIRLEWNAVPYEHANGIILGYTIKIDGSHTLYTNSRNTTSYTVEVLGGALRQRIFTSLEMFTDYTYQIRAYTSKGHGNYTLPIVVRTDEDAPFIAPLNVTVESLIWNVSQVNWTLVPSVQIPGICRGYVINYMRKEGTKDSPKNVTVSPTTTSVLISSLSGYILYDFWISAYTYPRLPGPYTNVTIRTKDYFPAIPPRDFKIEPTSSTTIKVTWETLPLEFTNGIMVGYLIEYTNNNKSISKNVSYPADVSTAILEDLWKFNYFSVRIISKNINGFCRYWSPTLIARTHEDSPDKPPDDIAGKASSPTAIMIKWNPVPLDYQNGFITGHSIFYRAVSEAEEELFGTPTLRIDVGPTTYGRLITGLSSFTEYDVTVLAHTVKGDGVKALTIKTSTCRCHRDIYTNWREMPPYVTFNASRNDHKPEGMMPEIVERSIDYCCQECPSFGRVKIHFDRNGYNIPAKKIKDIELKENIDDQTDLTFPIFGYTDQTHYAKYYGYVPLVPSSGVAFIVDKKQSLAQPNNVAQAVFNCWPLLMLNVIIAFSVGFIIWMLEYRQNPELFHESFIRGVGGGFWFAFVTLTTVGYGDKTVITIPGRIFTVFWTLFGLVMFGILMGSFGAAFETLAFSETSSGMMLYGAKVGALDNSSEHRLGLRKNAKVNSEKHFKTLEEIRTALLSGEVKGALIDAYVMAYYQHLFEHENIQLFKIYEISSAYGIVLASTTKKIQNCMAHYLSENRLWVAHHIQENSDSLKPSSKPVFVQNADELVSDSANIFVESQEKLIILLVLLVLAGLAFEGYQRYRRKKGPESNYKREPAITEELRTSLNKMIKILERRIEALKKRQEQQVLDQYNELQYR